MAGTKVNGGRRSARALERRSDNSDGLVYPGFVIAVEPAPLHFCVSCY
jgi:hypothetical protein